MQQSQGHHLTGPEVGLGVFGQVVQLLIDVVDKAMIKSEVVIRLSCEGKDVTRTSVEEW